MLTTKDEIYYAVIFTSIFVLILVGIIIYAIYLYLERKRKHLQDTARFNETLHAAQYEIQEQTLHYVGKELHDNLGQIASLIKINLNTLKLTDEQNATTEKIEEIKNLTRQLIADIKSLAVGLCGDRVIQLGLQQAIEIEIVRLNKTRQFEASFSQHGPIPTIEKDTTIILFRLVQEALNNIVKHSNARHVDVSTEVKDNLFILAVHDDGKGFDMDSKMNSRGAGLRNLQSRAKVVHAQLSIKSTIGSGTSIIVTLPL